jgi:hypothetical protein
VTGPLLSQRGVGVWGESAFGCAGAPSGTKAVRGRPCPRTRARGGMS